MLQHFSTRRIVREWRIRLAETWRFIASSGTFEEVRDAPEDAVRLERREDSNFQPALGWDGQEAHEGPGPLPREDKAGREADQDQQLPPHR